MMSRFPRHTILGDWAKQVVEQDQTLEPLIDEVVEFTKYALDVPIAKMGLLFVFDCVTGAAYGVEERPVPNCAYQNCIGSVEDATR